jgi:hypothetical protein
VLKDRPHGFQTGEIGQLIRVDALVEQLLAPTTIVVNIDVIPFGK